MRLIKAFLVGLTGLVIIITLFSLLIPSQVRVSRAVLINGASQQAVYDQVSVFQQWKNWHPVFTADSARMEVPAVSATGQPAVTISQRGKSIQLQMISADTNSIRFLLESNGENTVNNELVLSTTSSDETVQVEWRAITQLRWYPWQKFYGIFIDQLTGPSYEAALNGLKDYLENHQPTEIDLDRLVVDSSRVEGVYQE